MGSVTGSFILDYYVLVLLAASGVFQVAGALQGFRGLLLFQRRPASIIFGLVLLVGAFTWFFLSEPRNVSDSGHGLNGNEQFAYFFAGSGTALALTLILASLRNLGLGTGPANLPPGLNALRETSYIRALSQSGRAFWPRTRQWIDTNSAVPNTEVKTPAGPLVGSLWLGRRIVSKVVAGMRRAAVTRPWMRSWD